MLGKGTMSKVWHAYRKNTSEAYAIKAIEKTVATSFQRVAEERSILELVDNPFVIRMYWTFQDNSHVYFVLEHAEGGDLVSVMQNFHSSGMSEDHARFYIAEILLALEYLHGMGIVVRDMKPANCLTTRVGHIMLTDFSHSIQLLDTGTHSRSNNEPNCGDQNECIGTPEYMAPETVQEHGLTKMVDYWSLGIMLYELIFAHLPWGSCGGIEELDVTHLFYSIITQPVCFPDGEGEGEGGVSVAAKAPITGLLNKDPSKRMGNGAADVKAHRFFNQPGEELDWATARRGGLVPPPRHLPWKEADAAPADSGNNITDEPHPAAATSAAAEKRRWTRILPAIRKSAARN
jgi:serine/threonine protein kinase